MYRKANTRPIFFCFRFWRARAENENKTNQLGKNTDTDPEIWFADLRIMKSPKFDWPSFTDCLKSIAERPAMWLGRLGDSNDDCRSLRQVTAFITGFEHGQNNPNDSFTFKHFTKWVAVHYRMYDGPRNGFTLILEKVGGDEQLAFDEFFRLLPLYKKDLEEIGPDGIANRHLEVITQVVKEMRERIRKESSEE